MSATLPVVYFPMLDSDSVVLINLEKHNYRLVSVGQRGNNFQASEGAKTQIIKN